MEATGMLVSLASFDNTHTQGSVHMFNVAT